MVEQARGVNEEREGKSKEIIVVEHKHLVRIRDLTLLIVQFVCDLFLLSAGKNVAPHLCENVTDFANKNAQFLKYYALFHVKLPKRIGAECSCCCKIVTFIFSCVNH